MPARNYTTSVPVTRTIGEITDILARHGVTAVATMFADGKPSGLTFQTDGDHGRLTYSLPVDIPAMHRLLQAQARKNSRVDARPEQAARVAWRVVKDWLDAQMTLVEASLATVEQIMLPYLLVDDRTLYAHWERHDLRALPQR